LELGSVVLEGIASELSEWTGDQAEVSGHTSGPRGHRRGLQLVDDPRMTAKYAHVVDMAKENPALFIPVKVG
jgi:hypothetical protein